MRGAAPKAIQEFPGHKSLKMTLRSMHLTETALRVMRDDPRVRAIIPMGRTPEALIEDCILTGPGLDRFIEDIAREEGTTPEALISTDDNVRLEFATPRGNVLPWNAKQTLIERIERYRDPEVIRALSGS